LTAGVPEYNAINQYNKYRREALHEKNSVCSAKERKRQDYDYLCRTFTAKKKRTENKGI
jgi:hypothetical protein